MSPFISAELKGPKGRASVELLLDSGAMYSLLPRAIWKKLGLKAIDHQVFTLADGTRLKRAVSECEIDLGGGRRHVPVILGQAADQALIGFTTLASFGVTYDPYSRTLRRSRGPLKSAA